MIKVYKLVFNKFSERWQQSIINWRTLNSQRAQLFRRSRTEPTCRRSRLDLPTLKNRLADVQELTCRRSKNRLADAQESPCRKKGKESKFTNRFSGFTSRWTMLSECRYDSAEARSRVILRASASLNLPAAAMASNKSPPFNQRHKKTKKNNP